MLTILSDLVFHFDDNNQHCFIILNSIFFSCVKQITNSFFPWSRQMASLQSLGLLEVSSAGEYFPTTVASCLLQRDMLVSLLFGKALWNAYKFSTSKIKVDWLIDFLPITVLFCGSADLSQIAPQRWGELMAGLSSGSHLPAVYPGKNYVCY